MSRFTHLQHANEWPGLRTVDPFALQVTFDPYTWGPDVAIHLCNTRLDAGYRNIGGWSSPQERDDWFDRHSDMTFVLDSEFHVLPGSEIKLPIAFEVLQHYNQLYVDFPPTATEDGNPRSQRFYFFISDVTYRSPSSTGCIVTVDEWSTHMFDIDFEFIDLERGHAPMAAVSVRDFLSNPLENSEFLTIPDETFGGSTRLKYSARHVVNSGPYWLVVCMTADPEQDPGEFGHRENWRVPTSSAYRVQGAMSIPVFAVEPADANLLINRINERAPQLLPTIQAVFLIPKRMVTTGTSFSFLEVSCREIEPVQTVTDLININEDMFGYPAPYKDIAKLYTMPYAWIELVDETGRSQTIAVEETTGQLRVSTIASVLAPLIGVDCYVTGIGNGSSDNITWENMTSHAFNASGEWTRIMRHWNIPAYVVIQNSERMFEWVNHWQRVQARATIDNGYNLGIATNNLNYSLRGASLDRQVSRLSELQAGDNAQLALSQQASNDVQDINADVAEQNMVADKTLMDVTNNMAQQAFGLAQSNANAQYVIEDSQLTVAYGLSEKYQDYVNTSTAISEVKGIANLVGNFAENLSTWNNLDDAALQKKDDAAVHLLSTAVTDLLDLGQTFTDASWSKATAEAGLQTANYQLKAAKCRNQGINATYTMSMAQNNELTAASKQLAETRTNKAIRQSADLLAIQLQLDSDSQALNQTTARNVLDGDIAVARYQAAASKGMSDTSITAQRDLGYESLANTHRAGRLGSPKVFAQPTGSLLNYTRPQVLMANVKTQDPGAIAAAGDAFLRFGYRFAGRQWKVTSLTPMRHFTYWEGEPRFRGGSTNEVTRGILLSMFREGVFVWRDPSEIGSVSIYDNGRG